VTAFHCPAACGVVLSLVLSFAAMTAALMLFVLAMMRVAAAGVMFPLFALMFLVLFFAFVLGFAAALQRDTSGRATTAARMVWPLVRLVTFGVPAVLQRNATRSALLLPAAVREAIGLLVGLFDLGGADSVVRFDFLTRFTAASMSSTPYMATMGGRHVIRRGVGHIFHAHRTHHPFR
jgi:hypothetical protein